MKNNKLLFLIVVIILIAVGWWWFGQSSDNSHIDVADNDQVAIPSGVFDTAPVITLDNVAGGEARGNAWLTIVKGVEYHKAEVNNLPALENKDFYEGWLVDPKSEEFFSTGVMKDQGDGTFTLEYSTTEPKDSYTYVVITLEPDDGNPDPATHILEGAF